MTCVESKRNFFLDKKKEITTIISDNIGIEFEKCLIITVIR